MNDFYILSLESSSNLCSVALLVNSAGRPGLFEDTHLGRGRHAERVLPMAQDLLEQAGISRQDLSAIAFGQGPGGFTGLRVACSVAQGMAVALGLSLLPVDSLCAIAEQGAGQDQAGVHVVLQDARMGELYAAAYLRQGGSWTSLQAPVLLSQADVQHWAAQESAFWSMHAGSSWVVHGDAPGEFPSLLDDMQALGARPGLVGAGVAARAGTIAQLAAQAWREGRHVDAADAAPAYVRDKVAYTTLEREQGMGGNPRADSGMTSVHPMRPADLDEVVALECRLQAFPWTRKNFADGLGAGQTGWVVRCMGALQGYAVVLDTPDQLHLMVLGVRPDAQRQGIGSLLMQQCVRHARQAGLPAITLEVRNGNAQAIAFYRKHGFRQLGLRRAYYPAGGGRREDAWIMTLHLAEA